MIPKEAVLQKGEKGHKEKKKKQNKQTYIIYIIQLVGGWLAGSNDVTFHLDFIDSFK